MSGGSWADWYASEAQGFWGLLVVSTLFLALRLLRGRARGAGADPAAARFVDGWALVFGAAIVLDPLCTGWLAPALGVAWLSSATLALFVLLGDFRLLLLVFRLAGGRSDLRAALREALPLTPVVGIAALLVDRALGGGGPSGKVLWLAYEIGFLAVLAFLYAGIVARREPDPSAPRAVYLRAVLGYAALYYGLWALCDVLVLAGYDWPYALRALANQLYYGFFVPFAWWRFFASSKAAESASAQASR